MNNYSCENKRMTYEKRQVKNFESVNCIYSIDRMKRRYFTIVELLIVIAIIIIMAGLLLPALKKSREMGYDILCKSNLKQSGLAHFLYANDYNEYFPANMNPNVYPEYNLWNYYLINDYIKKNSVCRCPYALPRRWDAYYCYGSTSYKGFSKIQSIQNLNYYLLLADSSSSGFTSESTTPYWQNWGIRTSSYASVIPSVQCIFLRHSAFANVFFGDGKVEHVNKIKMLKPPYSMGSGNVGSSTFYAWIILGYGDF